jgi:mitogen-activated protein kinase kinase
MSDSFRPNSFKRRNAKGLTLSKPSAKTTDRSDGDAQVPGAIGNAEGNRPDTLEIAVEFELDLRSEDLQVLRELGAGNGGTVSKVRHASTGVVMARKVEKPAVAPHKDTVLTLFRTDHPG